MQTEQTNCVHTLEPGQLWKMEHGYVYIVEQVKQHIHYKMLRQPDQPAALTRMIGIEALLRYLRQSEAELVRGDEGVQLCGTISQSPRTSLSTDKPVEQAEDRPQEGRCCTARAVLGQSPTSDTPLLRTRMSTPIALWATGVNRLAALPGRPECRS
jgi:hypothetical protein